MKPHPMSTPKIRIALAGLGFGAEFIPIYQAHPNAEIVAICQRNPEKLKAIGDRYKIAKRYTDFDALLKDPEVDAIHINTPIPDHGRQSPSASPDCVGRSRRSPRSGGPGRSG